MLIPSAAASIASSHYALLSPPVSLSYTFLMSFITRSFIKLRWSENWEIARMSYSASSRVTPNGVSKIELRISILNETWDNESINVKKCLLLFLCYLVINWLYIACNIKHIFAIKRKDYTFLTMSRFLIINFPARILTINLYKNHSMTIN